MIVVSDTSPITALLTIGAAELLAQLFGEVVIPAAVRDELLRSHLLLPTAKLRPSNWRVNFAQIACS